MPDVLALLLAAELLGLAALPLARVVLGGLPGAGLAFAKPLGLLLAAYPVWLLASIGVVRYGTGAVIGGAVALALAGLSVRWRTGPLLADAPARRLVLGGEAVFVAAFGAVAVVTSFVPAVRGTEKPMDMAFLAAIDAGSSFPPHDPWMAGEDLNYYYFGHYLMAFATRLAGVEPAVGYNLSLALLAGLAAVSAYALGASLTAAAGGRRPVLTGIAAALLVCVAGNLDAAARLLADGGPLSGYDWFAPSRVIPRAITEFPAFSFLLGDLHAHVLAIPFTLLAIGFGLQVVLRGPRPRDLPAAGLAVGVLYAINSWSFPVAAGLVALAPLLYRGASRWGTGLRAAGWAVALLWVSVVALLPFWLGFDPETGGIADVESRRPFGLFVRDHALIFGALLWVLGAVYVNRLLWTRDPRRTGIWLLVGGLVAGGVLAGADLIGAGLLLVLVVVALRAAAIRRLPAERFGWLLVAAGMACVLAPELVYVRDEFAGTPLFRMNTIFKLGYQAWILLAVTAACTLPWGRRVLPPEAWRLWAPVTLILLVCAAVYPVAGTLGRTGGFRGDATLDGRAWLAEEAPGDVAAIEWLRSNAPPEAVVLEAVGEDYSEFGHARISTFSGRPAVLGWEGHELQWGHDPGSRRRDVDQLYRIPFPGPAERLLARYRVDYVVAGPLERADYGEAGLAKFDALGERVLDRDGTTLWRIR